MNCTDADLQHYRGLIYKTAFLQLGLVEDELDDIVQVLSIKVWRAVESFDTTRAIRKQGESMARCRDRYVFSCMTCAVKDLRKKKRRGTLSIEDIAPADSRGTSAHRGSRDEFEAKYLAEEADNAYREVEDEAPMLPNTLDEVEVKVITLLAAGYKQVEARQILGLEARQMEKVVRSLRSKMADWAPSSRVESDVEAEIIVLRPVAGVGLVPDLVAA